MNDDRTLKFAVDGFCSSRTTNVYKNTLPTVGFYSFLSILKLLAVYRLGLNKTTAILIGFKTNRLFEELHVLMHKDNAAKHETFPSLHFINMHR